MRSLLDKSNPPVQYDFIRHVGTRTMETFALSEPVLLVLLSLAEQPRHGYSILKDVESMSAGRVLLSTGTLYGALQRLLNNHWSASRRTTRPATGVLTGSPRSDGGICKWKSSACATWPRWLPCAWPARRRDRGAYGLLLAFVALSGELSPGIRRRAGLRLPPGAQRASTSAGRQDQLLPAGIVWALIGRPARALTVCLALPFHFGGSIC